MATLEERLAALEGTVGKDFAAYLQSILAQTNEQGRDV